MIFATVGTHNQGFPRFVKKMDEVAKSIDEEIVIQIGCTKYTPKNCKYFDYLDQYDFSKLCKSSSLIVTHGGIGSIMSSLKLGKPTIVVPRQKKFNEHTNDHQLQITKELEKQKRIVAVYNIERLDYAIKKAKKMKIKKNKGENRIKDIISEFIDDYENRNRSKQVS